MPPATFMQIDERRDLRRAVELAPLEQRFSYVLAVALAGQGQREEAIRVLDVSLGQRANDASSLRALAGYLREAGQLERAAEVRQKLDKLLRE
jgi:predicted Zn-dependent protease